jgi:hypothetical protein
MKGIKFIRYHACQIDEPDLPDPSFPFRMEAKFRPRPKWNEDIIILGKTRRVLDKFIKRNHLLCNPRLIKLVITGPGNMVIQLFQSSR